MTTTPEGPSEVPVPTNEPTATPRRRRAPSAIVIGHGNGKNKPSLVDHVRDANADSYGTNESNKLLGRLNKQGRLIAVHKDAVDRRARSTAIVTNPEREYLGEYVHQVSQALPKYDKVAPDRFLLGSFFAHAVAAKLGFEGVAHFELHADAGPALRDPKNRSHPLVREYRESLKSTGVQMRAARRDGLLPILTGDLQMPEDIDVPWSPQRMIAGPLKMKLWSTRIDYLIYPADLELASRPKIRKLYDHNGFVARLRPAR